MDHDPAHAIGRWMGVRPSERVANFPACDVCAADAVEEIHPRDRKGRRWRPFSFWRTAQRLIYPKHGSRQERLDFLQLRASFQHPSRLPADVTKTSQLNDENQTERRIWEKVYLASLDRVSPHEASAEADLAVRLWAKKWRITTISSRKLSPLLDQLPE